MTRASWPVLVLAAGLALGGGILPARAANLIALVNTGEIYASTNQGANWTVLATLPVHDAVGVAAGSTNARLYLATSSGGFYSSTNAGVTWSGVGSAPANDVAGFLLLSDLTVRLLTTSGSILTSTNQGVTFSGLATLNASDFVALAQVPVSQYLYALTRSGDVYESLDAGATWSGKGTCNVSDAVSLHGVGSSLFALTSTGDVYRSVDGAATWTGAGTLSEVGVTSLTADGTTLLAGLGTGEVASSVDGIGWTWKGTVNQVTLRSLGVDTPVASGVGPQSSNLGLAFDAPWPNPVRRGGAVNLEFRLKADSRVSFALYNASGRAIAQRPAEAFAAGKTHLTWTPPAADGSVYFLRMQSSSGQVAAQRVVVVP